MANFSNTNANLYPTFSTSGEFDGYPFLSRTLANEGANTSTSYTFADDWNLGGQPGRMVGPPRSLQTEAGIEPETSVTPYHAQAQRHWQPSFPEEYWPITNRYTQSHHSGMVNRENAFAGMAAPTPSSDPLNYWGDNESGPYASTSTFYPNVQAPHQLRTGLMPTRRFQPYVAPRTHTNERRNAEVGPTILVPPPTYLAPSTANPSGGISEATADAENDQTFTEEDADPTQPTKSREWRIRYSQDVRRLCVWAQGWENLPKIPSHKRALSIALKVVKTIRAQVYDGPRLLKGVGKRTAEGKKGADSEHGRRTGTRWFNGELSKYYQLPAGQRRGWACPALVLEVLEDVLGLPKPPV